MAARGSEPIPGEKKRSAPAFAPPAPTIVVLPSAPAADAALPPSVDRAVFDELPLDIQREILADHARTRSFEHSSASSEAGEAETTLRVLPARSRDESSFEFESSASYNDDDEDGSGWVCRVCTFVNHPDLAECELCETLRVYEDRDHAAGAPRTSPVSQALRRLRLPATPAATSLTNSTEPTADDLLVAATAGILKLQESASKGLLQAKDALMGKAAAASRSRSSSTDEIGSHRPSKQVALELAVLQHDLNLKCEPGSDAFESGLERLWTAVYGNSKQFERESDGWIDMGFQRTNPETDFRGGGMLALKCLLYAFEAHPTKMRAVLAAQTPTPGKRWYPVCVAGINLTCMIAGLLKLGNGQYEDTPETFWPLFEEPAAFYQLFFHGARHYHCWSTRWGSLTRFIVAAFVKMDATWRRMNASYMEFGGTLICCA